MQSLQLLITSFPLGPLVFLSNLFSDTLSLCSYFRRETNFHAHETLGKIISNFVYFSLYVFG
jgi:hypothetical protein